MKKIKIEKIPIREKLVITFTDGNKEKTWNTTWLEKETAKNKLHWKELQEKSRSKEDFSSKTITAFAIGIGLFLLLDFVQFSENHIFLKIISFLVSIVSLTFI
jgi:hypothetical protein